MKPWDVVMLKGEGPSAGPGGDWTGREEGWECTVVEDKGSNVLVKCKHNKKWYTTEKRFVVANLTQGARQLFPCSACAALHREPQNRVSD